MGMKSGFLKGKTLSTEEQQEQAQAGEPRRKKSLDVTEGDDNMD